MSKRNWQRKFTPIPEPSPVKSEGNWELWGQTLHTNGVDKSSYLWSKGSKEELTDQKIELDRVGMFWHTTLNEKIKIDRGEE